MALAIHASTPAIAVQSTGSVATVTTASFTPPAGSLILVRYSANSIDPNNPGDPTITDNLGAHLTYTAGDISHAPDNTGTQADGQVATWTAPVVSSAAMTITVTNGAASPNRHAALCITVLTGQDPVSPVGAHGATQTKVSTSAIAQNYTASGTGGQGFLVVSDWFDAGAETAGTGCTLEGSANVAANYTYAFIRRSSADDTAGVTNTLRATLPGASTSIRWAWIEILPPATTSIPYAPPRAIAGRDQGETWWIQRDRRNATLVATAANPLAAPLDSAWQAGARHWHLYNDRGRPGWQPQQRIATDPSLLTPAAATVPFAGVRTVPGRDPGEVPWTQRRPADTTLLAVAELENELLGGADTARRYLRPATYTPRWWMPEQPKRDGSAPGLLDQAELENELLGSGTTAERAGTPATSGPRWWAPQQPKRDGFTPGLLDTAQMEVPPPKTAYPAVRWWMPQQQPYRSDPSFYPTVAPTDPITLAYGAGGTYWLLYNLAAVTVDRREAPQQRRYHCDPALLAAALLEGPILTGQTRVVPPAAVWVRQARPQPEPTLLTSLDSPLSVMASRAWFPRPSTFIQQQRVEALAGPDQPGLSVELLRRYLTPATHGDRRQTAHQFLPLIFTGTPPQAVRRATSTPTALGGRTSTAAVAGRSSVHAALDGRISTSGVLDGRTSLGSATDRHTSTPEVEG